MAISLTDMIGKTLIVGVTYLTHEDEFIERKQFWGTVVSANQSGILLKQGNGEVFSLPPDLSSTTIALPGEYRLKSTGEVVINPDYLTTWIINKPEKSGDL